MKYFVALMFFIAYALATYKDNPFAATQFLVLMCFSLSLIRLDQIENKIK